MEIVHASKTGIFENNQITAFYGELIDLINLGIDVTGIIYDDEWKVKRFLNGHKIRLNKRIIYIFKYLKIDTDVLNKKIKDISQTDFKFVLLAFVLLHNRKIIIFDYFEVGLTYKNKKRLVKIIKSLNKDGKTIIVISKDLVFLNKIVDNIVVSKDNDIIFEGKLLDLVKQETILDPEIISFIRMANEKGARLDYTLDSLELLKDIYRSV